ELASPAREALEADNLSIAFGGVRAASGISLEARPGAITSLIGPNGAGKTTVLNMLGGFYRPDAGAIRVGGKELQGRAAWKISRAGVARTYQTTQLFGSMSVVENLRIARAGIEDGEIEALLAFVGYVGDLDARA